MGLLSFMKRRIYFGVLTTLVILNLVIGARIYFYSVAAAPQDDAYPNLKLFTTVLERVRMDYVDADKVSYQSLIRGALKGMLNTLDPHSEYLEPVRYEDLKKDTEGAFGGVGLVVTTNQGVLMVVEPMEDTPGARAGILPGDEILKIDGQSTERMGFQDAVQRLRGKPGSEVVLTIHRPSSGQVSDFKLQRAEIKIHTVKDLNNRREFALGPDKIGYVRLLQFGEQTASDLEQALRKLESQGMQALVLDLRDNPGGLLDQAVKVAEKFLPPRSLVVSTEGRNPAHRSEYRAGSRNTHPRLPMVVLVNDASASASEIVAGCLQDYQRAIIVGEQTFGKGSVQSIVQLNDGSALRLTTAKYYTPSHKVIHERGITPDIVVPMGDQARRDLQLLRAPGGLANLTEEEAQRVRQTRDVQLERAMDLLRGITLFTRKEPPAGKTAMK
jgi:carboxyl-terminal processing protease